MKSKKMMAFVLVVVTVMSLFTATAHAANNDKTYTYSDYLFICTTGGRHDIDLGNHGGTISLDARFNRDTRVILYDSSWNEVWSGTFSGSAIAYLNPFKFHQIRSGSDVRHVSIFLDSDKSVVIRSSK